MQTQLRLFFQSGHNWVFLLSSDCPSSSFMKMIYMFTKMLLSRKILNFSSFIFSSIWKQNNISRESPLLYFQHNTDQYLDWQSETLQHKNRKHRIPHTLICSQTWEADGSNSALFGCRMTGWPLTPCRWHNYDELDSQNSGLKIMARFGSVCKQPQEDASERQSGGSPGRPPGLGIQIWGQVGDRSPHSRRCGAESTAEGHCVDAVQFHSALFQCNNSEKFGYRCLVPLEQWKCW